MIPQGGCLRVFDYQQDVGSSAVFEDCDANHEIEGAKLWGARDNANGNSGCRSSGSKCRDRAITWEFPKLGDPSIVP